jgi:hypothetical protein
MLGANHMGWSGRWQVLKCRRKQKRLKWILCKNALNKFVTIEKSYSSIIFTDVSVKLDTVCFKVEEVIILKMGVSGSTGPREHLTRLHGVKYHNTVVFLQDNCSVLLRMIVVANI